MILVYGAGALLLHDFNSWNNWLLLLLKTSELTLIVILFSLLLLPLISWILFCSAAARKAPIFLSLLIPLALGMILKFSLGENYVTSNISHYLKSLGTHIKIGPEMLQQQVSFLVSTEFLIALALSTVLLLTSLWLRNNRYEI
jgi:ABC-2 type transport system permease protein